MIFCSIGIWNAIALFTIPIMAIILLNLEGERFMGFEKKMGVIVLLIIKLITLVQLNL